MYNNSNTAFKSVGFDANRNISLNSSDQVVEVLRCRCLPVYFTVAIAPYSIILTGLVPEPPCQVEEAQEDHQCLPHPGRPSALPWTSAVWSEYNQYRHGRWSLWHGNVWRRSLERGCQSNDGRWVSPLRPARALPTNNPLLTAVISPTNCCSFGTYVYMMGPGFGQLNQSSPLSSSLNSGLNSGINMGSALGAGSYQHYGLNALGRLWAGCQAPK